MLKGMYGALAVVMLVGCDTAPPPQQASSKTEAPAATRPPAATQQAPEVGDQPDQNALEQRVVARWNALVARNFDQAYTFETPSYRSTYTPEQYRQKFGDRVRWFGAKVTKVKSMENGVATVMVRLRYKAAVPIPGMDLGEEETNLKETWMQEGGTWFHITE